METKKEGEIKININKAKTAVTITKNFTITGILVD